MDIITAGWGFRELSLDDYFKIAGTLGIKYVEINAQGYEEVPLHLDASMTAEKIREIKQSAQQTGISIVVLAGTNDFTLEDKNKLSVHLKKVKQTIDLAQKIGANIIRVFAGWVDRKDITDRIVDQTAECLEEVGQYAEIKNIILAMENHGGITATARDCKNILDKVKSPAVGLNYDPANFIAYGYGEDPLIGLEILGERIVYAHLKDCYKKAGNGYGFCAVGEGEMDWDMILPALAKSHNGYWAIEYEESLNIKKGTAQSLEFLKANIEAIA